MTAKYNEQGVLEAFDVGEDCPYFAMDEPPYPHKIAKLKYDSDGKLEGIYGPGEGFYAFVKDYTHEKEEEEGSEA